MFRSTKQLLIAGLAGLVAAVGCSGSADTATPASSSEGVTVVTSTSVLPAGTVTVPPTSSTVAAQASTAPAATPVVAADTRFDVEILDVNGNGPAGVEAVDLDRDGDLDLVLNYFGDRGQDPGPIEFPPGGVSLLWNDEGGWRVEPIIVQDDGVYFPNEALPRDVDGDGDHDLVVGAGFFVCEFNPDIGPCGALFWLEHDEGAWIRHDIVGLQPGFYHRSVFADLDGDGIDDLVTVAEFQDDARAEWFRGTGDATVPFDPDARVIGQGGGSLPVVHDVDGDGDLDLASGEFFFAGSSYVWFEQVVEPSALDPAGGWQRHELDSTTGRTIQLSVIEDLFGDGQDVWIGSNHVNTVTGDPEPVAGIYRLDPGDDLRAPWTPVLLSDGIESLPTVGTAFQAAPGVFGWGDVDDDGDIDLTVSGDGDDRIFWFEQTAPGEFVQHTLAESFGQAAGGIVEDLDGDGDHEVVFTSYDTNEVVVFSFRG